nr:MAG TPA: hypothetical protein [Caudoviricetes sp.]
MTKGSFYFLTRLFFWKNIYYNLIVDVRKSISKYYVINLDRFFIINLR